jgi:hypothetical protein
MNQSEQKSGMSNRVKSIRRTISNTLLVAVMFIVGAGSSSAQQTRPQAQAQQSIQSVVANQAALVSEFEVNGLKVLLKRREGSLTVAAGLFIRGGAANINAQNAGIETLMLSAATEGTTNFPRERMRSELSRMGTVIGSSSNNDYSVPSPPRVCTLNARGRSSPTLLCDLRLRKMTSPLCSSDKWFRSATTLIILTFTCKNCRNALPMLVIHI